MKSMSGNTMEVVSEPLRAETIVHQPRPKAFQTRYFWDDGSKGGESTCDGGQPTPVSLSWKAPARGST
eukprot:5402860-Amphidinium_carterae.1